jgi:hydrogenase expression/formation protein HypC
MSYSGDQSKMCLAIPGQVVEVVDEENRLATIDVAGVRRTVNIGLLDVEDTAAGPATAGPGDWVLIHVGFALSKIHEQEAQATLKLLQEMGAEYEQELEELKASVIE